MKQRIITFALVGFFICAGFSQAEMSSTNYEIRWDSFNAGGSDTSSSASYLLQDSIDGSAGSTASSSSYQLAQGYQAGIDSSLITFEVKAQDMSSGRAASLLSGTTVSADPSGISVGNLIVMIQDIGATQVSAIGRVASIGVGTMTVDAWKTGGTSPVIDGVNDYVYPMTSTSVSFGTLSVSSVSLGVVAFEVTSANSNGYVVQVFEDGNLRSGASDVNDVIDGSVSSGSEEYGARSSDTTLAGSSFDTQDAAMTSTFQDIATESSASYESRNFVTLKAAISSSTTAGSYTQSLSFIASGNY